MKNQVRFRIKEYAQEQGLKLSGLARKLGMSLSNLSAIASGRRSVSLALLGRIAQLLHCHVSELFEEKVPKVTVYQDEDLNKAILRVAEKSYENYEKGWVPRLMLAYQNHYKNAKILVDDIKTNKKGGRDGKKG